MPATVSKLGPGSLSIGDVGSPVDFSCQVENCQVQWDKKSDDPIMVLCGEQVPGATTYTAQLTGTLFQDQADADGIVRYSWANKGTVVPFVFVPNTADGVQVSGEVTIDPITVGDDAAGANMDSDFTWDCVGEPVLEDVVPLAADAELADAGV
jgi:hypothetical protein